MLWNIGLKEGIVISGGGACYYFYCYYLWENKEVSNWKMVVRYKLEVSVDSMEFFEQTLEVSGREDRYDVFMPSALCNNSAVVESGAAMEGCQQSSSLLACERIWMGKIKCFIFMIGSLHTWWERKGVKAVMDDRN